MITNIKYGCKTIKKTNKFEIYQLGNEFFKFIYKTLEIIKLGKYYE